VSAAAPPSGNVAPPGYYYLFVNRMSDKSEIPWSRRSSTSARSR
jgi:hypothetical protein